MSTISTLNINGLIGKEFLYDENLFISNYNPFVTTNTSGTPGLYQDTTLTGKLYIFNKKEYKEPSNKEFQNIKSISELAAAPYRLINDASFNSLSVSILSKYDENSKERTFQLIKENSVLDINPVLSNGLSINDFLYNPENNNLGTFTIFVIDHSTETGKLNKKVYTDLAVGEQFLMYLIPSELINVSESGMDSTKLISLTLSDASKQSISTNSFEVIPSTIPEESGLNYFYAKSSLTIPGDTNYTRTNTFNSINIYFKVTPNTNFNFETNGFGLSEILKQSIFNNLKTSLLNDVKFSTFDINVLSLDKLIFSLNNNEIFVSLTLSNTESNIILPETPTLNLKLKDELSYIEETVNEFLNVTLLNFKGTYLLPLVYYTLRYNDSNGVDGFFELQQLAQNNREGICFSTGDKDLDLPNRKVYLYGGAFDKSTATSNNLTNTLLRSNIQNDGSLEGFTQIGTNSLNLFQAATYTYINDPVTGTGWVYVFGGLAGAVTTASNKVKRAPILSDGTIGTWEDILTLPANFRYQRVIGNPEDKRYFYVYSSLRTIPSNSYYDFINTIYTFKINEDGSISLLQTYTSTENHYQNSSIILKDPVSNKQFLYIFGTRDAENDPSIYRYEIAPENQDPNLSYNIIGNVIKVGNLDNTIMETHLIEDNENIYIVGGRSNSNYKIGARRTVLKYPKKLLIKGSPTNLVNPEILPNLSIPISVSVNQITTKYGSYIICPITTTNETGTTYNWQSTNRVLGFKFNETNLELASSKLILNEFGNYPDDLVENKIDQRTNFFPNKFGTRIKEELYTNLFVKQNQVLEAYGETIKFVNPSELTKPITIEEITKPIALPAQADIFLKWMEELSINTFFDKYNEYRYFAGKYDVEKDFSLVIPELIFNILYTKDLYELNKEIFKTYLISNPPSIETDPEMIINEDYIDTILYCFYKCRVGKDGSYVSNKNALTFGASGLSLPDISSIEYSSKVVDYRFIFFPQRHKGNEQAGKNKLSNLPTIPTLQSYFEKGNNLSGCSIDPKVPEEEIEKYLNVAYMNEFDYFIAPNGNDSNSGRRIDLPKKTVASCPAGSKILLLPGEYDASILVDISSQIVYGCGSMTNITTFNDYLLKSRVNAPNTIGKIINVYFNLKNSTNTLIFLATNYYNNPNFTFKNCTFNLNNTNCQRQASTGNNYGTLNLINCNFINVKNYVAFWDRNITSVVSTTANTELEDLLLNSPNLLFETNKNLIANLKDNYAFKPMYTLLPLNKGENENNQSKTINLETTGNISKIPNLNYKLS